MAKLDQSLQIKVDAEIEFAKTESTKGDNAKAIAHLKNALALVPEPKGIYEDGHFIVKYIIQVCLKAGMLDEGLKWANDIYQYGTERFDGGEREYLHGRVEFALKNMDKAKTLFSVAFKKSEGRFPPQKDTEYIRLLSSK